VYLHEIIKPRNISTVTNAFDLDRTRTQYLHKSIF